MSADGSFQAGKHLCHVPVCIAAIHKRQGSRGREAVSDQRIARSLRAAGGCKMGYAILIIFFDLSINQIISAILSQLMGS